MSLSSGLNGNPGLEIGFQIQNPFLPLSTYFSETLPPSATLDLSKAITIFTAIRKSNILQFSVIQPRGKSSGGNLNYVQ